MKALWHDLSTVLGDQLRRVPMVVALMLAAACLDLLGVSLVAPFVAAAFNPGQGSDPDAIQASLQGEAQAGGLGGSLWIGLAIVVALGLRAVAGFQLQRVMVRFSDLHRGMLMAKLLNRYLSQPWAFHLGRSQAELTNTLLYEVALYTGNVLNASLRLIADFMVLLLLGAFLLWLSPAVALAMGCMIGVTVVLVNLVTRKAMRENAERIVRRYERVVETVGNSLAALKQARVLGSQRLFASRVETAAREQAEATALQNALQTVPRSALEMAVLMLMLGAIAWSGGSQDSLPGMVATLGAFGVASLRLIPAATSVANQINLLKANRPVLARLAADLRLPLPPTPVAAVSAGSLPRVELKQVSYVYPGTQRAALQGVNLLIEPGQCCGIVGPSGSGKSTLGDLLLGLLSPTEGSMLVDNLELAGDSLSWTRRCAYIPQDPCLFNDSLRTNITLSQGRSDGADEKIIKALSQAALGELLAQLPGGLDESLGDNGQRVSGGQRQRLAIARAFYHEREFLVFDEATSALDEATEGDIVKAIAALKGRATVLVITHREALLTACERVYRMRDGALTDTTVDRQA